INVIPRPSVHPSINGEMLLDTDMRDARGPIPKCATRIAASEVSLRELREIAGLSGEFVGKPNGVAIRRCRSIVAPPRAPGVRRSQLRIGAEPVIRSRAVNNDMNIASASQCVQRGVSRTWI